MKNQIQITSYEGKAYVDTGRVLVEVSAPKLDFLMQYVLNRAGTVDHLDGQSAAKQAILAWGVIEREMK